MTNEEFNLKIAQLDELARAGRAILATIEAECKPAPERDICIRPEPELVEEVWFMTDVLPGFYQGHEPVYNHFDLWQRRRLFLTREEAERATEMELLRARAITARDAINGERGLPKARHSYTFFWDVDRTRVSYGDAAANWRFWSQADAQKWLAAIGGDAAFRNLMEVE